MADMTNEHIFIGMRTRISWWSRFKYRLLTEHVACKIKRLLFICILLSIYVQYGKGQSQNVVYQTLATGISTNTYTTGNVRNIGQSGHLAYVIFTDAPSQTCVTPVGTGGFEGSFNNSVFISFGVDGPVNLVNLANTVPAEGSFPYVRFKINGFDTTKCRASVYYSGTIATPVVGSIGTLLYGSGGRVPPLIIGGISANTAVILPVCGPTGYNGSDFTGSSTLPVSITSGNSAFISGSNAGNSPHTVVYLCGALLAGSAANTTVTIYGVDTTTTMNCTGTPSGRTTGALPLPNTGVLQLGGGMGSVFTVPTNEGICMAAANGNVNGIVNVAQF